MKSTGLLAVVVAGASLLSGPAAAWRPSLVDIAIDGNYNDWQTVLANPRQFTYDGDGSSFASCANTPDRDCVVANTGRDIYHFAWSYDPTGTPNPEIYLYTERVNDQNNAQQNFFFIMDARDPSGAWGGDGYAGSTDFVLKVAWKTNSSLELYLYRYVPAVAGTPDPMAAPSGPNAGYADGWDMPGSLGAQIWSATQPGQSSLRMECSVPWDRLDNAPYGTAILFHVAAGNSANSFSSAEDNCGSPDGTIGRFGYTGVEVRPDNFGNASSPGQIIYAHEVINFGTAEDTIALWTTSSRRLKVELWADIDGNGALDESIDELMAIDGNGDGDYNDPGPIDTLPTAWDSDGDTYPDTGPLTGGDHLFVLVKIVVRAGLAGLTDVTTVHAASTVDPGEMDTATDATALGRITLSPAGDRMGEPGSAPGLVNWIPHPATVTNNSPFQDLGNFEIHSILGWDVRLYRDDNGDGVGDVLLGIDLGGNGSWEAYAGDTDRDNYPDTGLLEASSALHHLDELAVVIEVGIPHGVAIGIAESTLVRILADSDPSDPAATLFRTTAADRVTLTPSYQVSEAAFLSGSPSTSVYFKHVLYNGQTLDDCFLFSQTSTPAVAWTVRFWSDPNGDGNISDGEIISSSCDTEAPVAKFGGTYRLVMEVIVPAGLPTGTTQRFDVTATSQIPINPATATVIDETVIGHLRAFRDAALAVQANHFTNCDTAYVQAVGLATGTTTRYTLRFLDPDDNDRQSGSLSTDGRGNARSRYLFTAGDVLSSPADPWRVVLIDTSPNPDVTVDTLRLYLERSGEVLALATDQNRYLDNTGLVVDALVENSNDFAPFTDSVLRIVVTNQANTQYLTPFGTFAAGNDTNTTFVSDDIDLIAGAQQLEGFALASVDYPATGSYRVSAFWRVSCDRLIDSETAIFYVVPAPPVITAPISGTITHFTTIAVAGTSLANASIALYRGATQIATPTADGSGIWTVSAAALVEGTNVLTATQTDGSGMISDRSTAVYVVVDTVAPTAPTMATPLASPPPRNDDPVVFSGSCEAGTTITLTGLSSSHTTTCTGVGSWSISLTAAVVGQGSHTVSVTSTDTAGNSTPMVGTRTFVVDTIAPVAPTVTAPADGSTLIVSNVTVSGTAEPGSSVEIWVDGMLDATVPADGSTGAFSTIITLGDGTHLIEVIAVDAASNTSPATDVTVTIDTANPAAPIILAPTNGQRFGAGSGGSVTISGTAEIGTTVHLYENGTEYATAVVDGSGNWSAAPRVFADGSHQIEVFAVDGAGLASQVPDTVQFFVDTSVPLAPVITAPAAGAALGSRDVVFSGSAESGTTVHIIESSVEIGSALVAPDGSWSLTVAGMAEGPHTVTATVNDAAGNVSPATAPRSFTVDVSAPADPTITAPANDAYLNNRTVTVSGTAEASSWVELREGLTLVATTQATGGGTWTTNIVYGSDGQRTLVASSHDAAGNSSAGTAQVTFTVDTLAPTTPVVFNPADGSATNDPNVSLSGTCESGSSVLLSGDFNATVPCVGGLWSYDVNGIAPGDYTFSVSARDLAGNTSGTTTVVFTVDRTPPAAPVITTPTEGHISAAAAVTVGGTAEAGASVWVFANGTPVGSTVANGSGAWSASITFGDGSWALTAIATDAADNQSPPSATVNITIDLTPPLAPVITAPADGSTVTSSVVTVSGTAEADTTILVLVGGVPTIGTSSDGSWSVNLPALADGSYQVTAVATDSNGRNSETSAPISFTVDTTLPAPPAITLPLDNAYLVSTTVAVAGTCSAATCFTGMVITVLDDGAVAGTATVQADDSWSTSVTLGVGASVLTAFATDALGRDSSPSNPVNVLVDDTSPLAPVIEFPATGALFGTDSVPVSGTATAGELVTVTARPTSGANVVASTTTLGDGSWSLGLVLTEGGWTLEAVATDAAARPSPPSNSVTLVVDLTAPAAPVITAPVNNAYAGSSPISMSGTAEAGAVVVVYVGGTAHGSTTAASDGSWTVNNVPLAEGANTLTARATDQAGNPSALSTPVVVNLDSTGPNAPAITAPVDDTYLTSTGVNITGTAAAGETITVYAGASVVGTVTVPAGGTWSVDVTLPEGASVLTATATDQVGRTSPASGAIDVVVDTSAPLAPVITAPANNSWLASTTVRVSGTATSGETVDVTATSASGTVLHLATVASAGAWAVDFNLADGGWTFVAIATDLASRTSPQSNTVAITIDPNAPLAPAITSPTDNAYVTTTTVHVAGTAVAGETITVYAGASVVGTVTVPAGGNWTLDVTLPEGASVLTATATDQVGRTSPASGAVNVVVDTSAPVAPVIVVPEDDTYFNTQQVHVSGTATHGETVEVTATSTSGTVLHLTATARNDGTWSVDFVLAESGWILTAMASDAAGRESAASNAVAIVVDLTAPEAPVIVEPVSGTTLHTTTVTVSGTAEHGTTIEVLVDGVAVSTTTSHGGSWSIEITLTEGNHVVTATATDPAGNVSPLSDAISVTVDLTPPPDAGVPDSASPDSGHDAARPDTGHDAAQPDSGRDAGRIDAAPRPDAATPDRRGRDTGGTTVDAGHDASTVPQTDAGRPEDKWLMEGGCGCRTTGDSAPGATALGLLVLGLLVLRRRSR